MSSNPWEQFKVTDKETEANPWEEFKVTEEVKEEEPGILSQGGRLGAQVGLGILGRSAFLPSIMGALQGTQAGQLPEHRQAISEEIEDLGAERRRLGKLSEQDELRLKQLIQQQKDPVEQAESLTSQDISITGAIKGLTGIDLEPKGVLEHGANLLGFIKKPSTVKEVIKSGGNYKSIMQSLFPKGGELASALTGGEILDLAEEGEWGPLGTFAALVTGELLTKGAIKGGKILKEGQKSLGKGLAKTVKESELQIQKELIRDLRDSGIQADVGTLTNSNAVKLIQTTLAQSGLTGDALDKLKTRLLDQVKGEYGKLADGLAEAKFATQREASEEGKKFLLAARDQQKGIVDDLYADARNSIPRDTKIPVGNLERAIENLEEQLVPGSVKSEDTKAVLKALNEVKKDIGSGESDIRALLNNKTNLGEKINFEVQGDPRKLLIGIQKEIDNSLSNYAKGNKDFFSKLQKANKKFANLADTFRNDTVNKIILDRDPETLFRKMNTIQGMRDVEKAMSKTAPGRKAFKQIQRAKLDDMIGKRMTDNVTEQLKSGTFANLLKNPKDAQLVREMLGKEGFNSLSRLQKNVGKMAQSSQKFFNASKTASQGRDFAVVASLLSAGTSLFGGNPWGLYNIGRIGGAIIGGRKLTKLIADPEFLKLVEEAIIATEKNDISKMSKVTQEMMPYLNVVSQKGESQQSK